MKILVILISLFISFSAFADQAITVYRPSANGTVAKGCHQIIFITQGVFTGTIGNATFSTAANTQTVIPVSAVGDGQVLGAVSYTLAGAGSLVIIEVR